MKEKITASDIAEKALKAANDTFENAALSQKEKADIVLQYVSAAESAAKIANCGY